MAELITLATRSADRQSDPTAGEDRAALVPHRRSRPVRRNSGGPPLVALYVQI